MIEKLSPELIIKAYSMGMFPMGDNMHPYAPLQWYMPDPRCIIDPNNFHIPKRLARTYKQGIFELKINTAWDEVLKNCANRKRTWITKEIYQAYTELYKMGLAHSAEAYYQGTLAGGVYGVSLKGAFMGESMFHLVRDASKVALVYLLERLKSKGFILFDCQFMTDHLQTFGAINISQQEYQARLQEALKLNCLFI